MRERCDQTRFGCAVAAIAARGRGVRDRSAAAAAGADAAAAATPTFRTTTRLIVQTVTVKDKDGKPIEGLTAKDFVVTEDGEPQTISFVEFQRLPPPRGTGSVSVGEATPDAAPARRCRGAAAPRRRRSSRRPT